MKGGYCMDEPREACYIRIKKAMELMNMIDGQLRSPLCEISEDNLKILKKEMIKHKLL